MHNASMYFTGRRCASLLSVVMIFVRYLGNHIDPATLCGSLQSTGPRIKRLAPAAAPQVHEML